MGDCRIRFRVSKEVYADASVSDADFHIVTQIFSADTTIREVFEVLLLPLLEETELPEAISIWDCTIHPPRDITAWPTTKYSAKGGPKSRTLYDAGWFPSGVCQILPRGTVPKISSIAEDSQYNSQAPLISFIPGSEVAFVSSTHQDMTPSQILRSVESRFDFDEPPVDESTAQQTTRQWRMQQAKRQYDRHAKLEAQISKLNSNTKPSKVSLQVRNMLIKSRCTGLGTLKIQDRVYLHAVIIHDESTSEDYRYFSIQDTVARIVSTLVRAPSSSTTSLESEFLIKLDDRYQRLPMSMRLYEAINNSLLQNVDSIVIRVYNPTNEEATTSLSLKQIQTNTVATKEKVVGVAGNDGASGDIPNVAVPQPTNNTVSIINAPSNVSMAISPLDVALLQHTVAKWQDDTTNKKKSASTTSIKVQQMLMKSKAKGDKKRTPKVEDRFFVQVMTTSTSEAGPFFMNRKDTVGRLLQEMSLPNSGRVFCSNGKTESEFSSLPLDVTLEQAEQQGVLTNFGRLIVLLNPPNEKTKL